jgi:hypothetical protein
VKTGDSTTGVARKRLCGHVDCPITKEYSIMEETSSVPSVRGYITMLSSSKPDIVHIRGLNLAVVKLTTVQMTKLPL